MSDSTREHCEKHDCEATNGCALCKLEEEQPNIQAAPAPRREGAACAVPITDIVACTRPKGHEGNHHAHGHDYGAPSCPMCPSAEPDDGLWTLLSGLGISDLIQAPVETRTERGGLVRYVEISDGATYTVDDGFKPDEFVAVVHQRELRALGQLALTAQEAEKQRAGAVRHLEAVRAELVKVTAERDAALINLARANKLRLDVVDKIRAEVRAEIAAGHDAEDAAAFRAAVIQAAGGNPMMMVNVAPDGTTHTVTVETAPTQHRRRLPAERQGVTHAFAIRTPEGRHKGYITVGLYEDGSVGEVFLKLDQQGSQVSGFCDAWSIAVSMLLQTGTSLETVCRKFRGARFEPSGRTETPGIRVALSPVDYAARYLERRFVSKLPLTDDDAGPPAEGEGG